MAFLGLDLILDASEDAELTLDGHVVFVSVLDDLLCEFNVLLVGESGAVDHDGREAHVDAVLAEFEAVTMVKVENDLGMFAAEFFSVSHGALGEVAQESSVGVVASAF